MRVALPLIALLFATSASAQQSQTVPLLPSPSVVSAPPQKNCRDRVHTVRTERGPQRLDRSAETGDPLMILAVHKTIDGCTVLVTANGDLPLPEPQEHQVMPAR